jgi:hypothetical protein
MHALTNIGIGSFGKAKVTRKVSPGEMAVHVSAQEPGWPRSNEHKGNEHLPNGKMDLENLFRTELEPALANLFRTELEPVVAEFAKG